MSVRVPNVELLRRTLAFIEANPKRWDQFDWRNTDGGSERCGTAYCFAGWAAILSGSTWDVPDDKVKEHVQADGDEDVLMEVDGGVSVETAARNALGLTDDEAFDLFHGDNRLSDLRRIVGELCSVVN